VAVVNLSAMTIFLWHQTSLIAVTLLVPGPLAGLHSAPRDATWLTARVLWLPVFAGALVLCWLLFHRFERRPGPPPQIRQNTRDDSRADTVDQAPGGR
jgi:hypothetical protein